MATDSSWIVSDLEESFTAEVKGDNDVQGVGSSIEKSRKKQSNKKKEEFGNENFDVEMNEVPKKKQSLRKKVMVISSSDEDDEGTPISDFSSLSVSKDDKQEDQEMSSTDRIQDYTVFTDGVMYRRHDHNSIILVLEEGKRVYFSGRMEIQLLYGSVEVYGHKISQTEPSFQCFSPKGHSSLLFIKGMWSTQKGNKVPEQFKGLPAKLKFAGLIIKSFENEWTLGLRQTAVNGDDLVGPQVSTTIHPRLVVEEEEQKLPSMKYFMEKFGFQFIPDRLLQKNRLFDSDPKWETLFQELDFKNAKKGPQKISVFGGKGAGKSTFCRWLMNKYLSKDSTRILFIDLDPGQTEFNPPGLLALHVVTQPLLGPNFTHLRQPEKAVFLGGVNVADIPVTYVQTVMKLLAYASEKYSDIPWIINTMGFSSGLGVSLNISVIKIFRPTTLVQLTVRNNPKASFPFDLNPVSTNKYNSSYFVSSIVKSSPQFEGIWRSNLEYRFVRIESVCGKIAEDKVNPWGNNPKALRETMLISYFSEMLGTTLDSSLLPLEPFRFSLDAGTIATIYSNNLNWDGVIRTLLGNLVALCTLPEEVLQSSQCQDSSSKKFISTCTPIDNDCLGYGICRAYDKANNFLYFLTPIPAQELKQVNAIICAGGIGMPLALMTGGNNNAKAGPYLSSSSGGAGRSLDAPSQKNYVPGKKVTHSVLKDCFM